MNFISKPFYQLICHLLIRLYERLNYEIVSCEREMIKYIKSSPQFCLLISHCSSTFHYIYHNISDIRLEKDMIISNFISHLSPLIKTIKPYNCSFWDGRLWDDDDDETSNSFSFIDSSSLISYLGNIYLIMIFYWKRCLKYEMKERLKRTFTIYHLKKQLKISNLIIKDIKDWTFRWITSHFTHQPFLYKNRL